MSLRLAILASGNGSNAQAMFDAVERGALDADIRLVLSNRPGARVLERAAARSLPCRCLDHTQFPDRAAYDRALAEAVREAGADTVALAGYMRLLSPDFLAAFPGRVLNIHPACCPPFPACTARPTPAPGASNCPDAPCISSAMKWTAAPSSSRPACPRFRPRTPTPCKTASTDWNTAFIPRPCNGWPKTV